MTPLAPPSRRLVVVGACGGIGAALVATAVQAGDAVLGLDLPRALAAGSQPGADYLACDVCDEASVQAAFAQVAARWDALDALVYLAGYTGERTPVAALPTDDWQGILQANLSGAFLVARASAPLLARGRSPAAVFISSTFGVRVPHTGYAAYASAKAGVINLVRALATEWAPAVRVNCVAPGAVDTAFLRGGTGRPAKSTGLDVDKFVATVPLGRLGQPQDIVGPIRFLLGPDAAYMTGQTLHVNGGSWTP